MSEVELQQIGAYSVSSLLHTSSTSNFYLSTKGKKRVVIQKFSVPITIDEDKKAFLAHAKRLQKLVNRSIIHIEKVGFDDDFAFLVLEYKATQSLAEYHPASQQLSLNQVRSYLSTLANALHYAHTTNVIHKNLHPGNILIDQDHSSSAQILLTGFAITPSTFPVSLDECDHAIPYMAPEQLQDHPEKASDQYALAVMVYEWLCGCRPYMATDQVSLLRQQQEELIPAPSKLNTAVSPAVEQVLLHALAFDPQQRFAHIHDFSGAFTRALVGTPIELILPQKATGKVKTTQTRHNTLEQFDEAILESLPHTPSDIDTSIEPQQEQPDPLTEAEAEAEAEIEQYPEDMDDIEDNDEPLDLSTTFSNPRLPGIVADDLRQGGVLSQRLPGYEERPAQIEMASTVARAINQHVPAIIEAATGTGKSLAYLVPVVRSGQVAIVSTANKALQEQLFYKDIPFVQHNIKPFKAALVKGVNNYVCLDRVETERTGLQFYAKNQDFQHLMEIIEDPDGDFDGDFENLEFPLPGELRGRVSTDSDQCAWSKCSYFENCYVRQMREKAEQAQVIVVNHTLLLLDAAIGGFLLPERDLIILDEAHHLEEEATRSFTITVAPARIQTLLAQRMLKTHSQMSLQDDAMRAAQLLWMRLEQIADPRHRGRTNLEEPVEEGLRLATTISDLADSLRKQRPKELPDKEGQIYDKLLKRAQNLAEDIRTVFSVTDPTKFVYYVERVEGSASRGFTMQASAAPLDVTTWLKERLFKKCNVISTSATLATVGPDSTKSGTKGPNFAYFRRRIGLDPLERSDVIENILPLTFDYESNALLYLPRDLPAPTFGSGSDDYMIDIARKMYSLVTVSQGRAFLLFSSKRMLDRAFELMEPHLPYPLLKQGDMTRKELTRRFREEKGAVLFGLKSFWEGVDITGDALSLVVIDKLPFDPPDDPVHEARVAQMKAAGENWFGTYVLPQAVLRLKQGIGRLLRTREDRGVMAILDTRLHTKGYGRMVLDALPPARRTSDIREVKRFFAQEENDQ